MRRPVSVCSSHASLSTHSSPATHAASQDSKPKLPTSSLVSQDAPQTRISGPGNPFILCKRVSFLAEGINYYGEAFQCCRETQHCQPLQGLRGFHETSCKVQTASLPALLMSTSTSHLHVRAGPRCLLALSITMVQLDGSLSNLIK